MGKGVPESLSKRKELFQIILFSAVCIATILYFSWEILLFSSIFLLAIVSVNLDLELALAVLIFAIPVTRFPVISEYVEILKLAFSMGILIVWFMKKNIAELSRIKNNPLTVFFALFLALMSVNLFFSIDKRISMLMILSHTVLFFYFYLFCEVFRNEEFLFKTVFIFIATAIVISLIAIMQYLTVQYNMFPGIGQLFLPFTHRYGKIFGTTDLFKVIGYRSVGTFYHPNLLGLYISIVLPVALALSLGLKDIKIRIPLFIGVLIMIAGMFCSGSRGAFLSLGVSVIFIILFLWKEISKWEVGILIAIPLALVARFHALIIYYLRLDDILSYRDLIWDNTIRLISMHPFSGIGLGVFHKAYMLSYGFPSLIDFQNTLKDIAITGSSDWLQGFHAHNLFLNYAAEMGVFVIPLLGLFYLIMFKQFIEVLKKRDSISRHDFISIVGSVAGVAGNLVYSFFEAATNFYNFSIGLAFMLVSGMGISLIISVRQRMHAE